MLRVILWKHTILRTNKIRNIILTLLELLVPIIGFLLLIYAKSTLGRFDKVYVNESTYLHKISNQELLTRINVASTNILYAPDTEFTSELVREAQLKLNIYNERIQRFRFIEDMVSFYNAHEHEGPTVMVTFNNVRHTIPKQLDYDIKIYEEGVLWNTAKLFSDIFTYTPGIGSETYLEKAFAAVKVAIDTSFIEMASKSKFVINLTYQEFPFPPHLNTDGVTTSFRYILPFITIITFIFICPMTLKRLVLEKSSGLKELLKIAGVKPYVLWLGWFLNGIILNAVSVICIAFILTQRLFDNGYPIIEYCNVFILMLFLLLYCSATIAFFLAFSVIFHRATLAMVLGVLFWIISYIIFVGAAADMDVMSITIKGLFLLFPTISLFYGFNTISIFEMRETNLTFSSLFMSPTSSYDDLSLGIVMGMLIFDTIFYFALALYFDKICPGPYGIAKPWNFLLNKIWEKISKKNLIREMPENSLLRGLDEVNLKPLIKLKDVTKIYDSTVAVSNLSMNIYEGTITGLLGENGAGKTTTMSMLTGLTKATSGAIYIDSCAINKDVDLARRKVALCTQHDLLYDEMTVKDHLVLFGMLKGLSAKKALNQAMELLEDTLQLNDQASKFVADLSGGMKRKLSLGIALMGNPEILILDEPTSGVDVDGRREIWDLILSFKGKRTVLISTHFLEEAERLSDFIAIMDCGSLLCFGTPIELKKKYDVGYKCRITYKNPDSSENIHSLLKNFPAIRSIDEPTGKVIQCRFNEQSKNEIPKLLRELDRKQDEWLLSYKLSSNTLEDVYLKVQNKGDAPPKEIDLWTSDSYSAKSLPSVHVKYCNIVSKRLLYFKKKVMQYMALVLLTFSVVLLAFILGNSGYEDVSKDGTRISLKLRLYGKTDVYYSISGDDPKSKLEEYYKGIVTSSESIANKVDNVSETIIQKGTDNIAHYMKRMLIATEFVFDDNRLSSVNVMHANKAYHGSPISINTVMNTLLKYYAGSNYSISATYTPLHAQQRDKQGLTQSEFSNLFLWLILLPIGPLLLISASLLLPTVEYAKSTRMLEKLFGLSTLDYWLINFAVDFIYYCFCIFVILAFIFIIPIHYLDLNLMVNLLVLLLFYGFACIPFAYTFTFTDSVEGAYSRFLIFHIICAPIIAVILLVLENADTLTNIATWKSIAIMIIEPHVALCYSLAKYSMKVITIHNWDIMAAEKKRFLCSENKFPCCVPDSMECRIYKYQLDFDFMWHSALTCATYMVILIVWNCMSLQLSKFAYYAYVAYLSFFCCAEPETNIRKNRKKIEYKGEDERYTNQSGIDQLDGNIPCQSELNFMTATNILKVQNVSKAYIKWKPFRSSFKDYFKLQPFNVIKAVKCLNLELKKGMCVGLLGVNGAGKTTSFRILTNQLKPTDGSLKTNGATTDSKPLTMGYCPQHNALIDEFTARELLHMYGKLRNQANVEEVTRKLLDKFGLTKFADKPCGIYSGGNKRKLATCISIIGFPTCILLDEPTSGVDPVSRRELWDIIGQIKQRKESGILLTSHSMDECEELCDRLCILKDGEVEADASINKLKRSYCIGHVLNIKLKSVPKTNIMESGQSTDEPDGRNNIAHQLCVIFEDDNVVILGTHNAVMHVRILKSDWSTIFEKIENMKNDEKYNIDDYWVKEASLDEVFLEIAKSDASRKDRPKRRNVTV